MTIKEKKTCTTFNITLVRRINYHALRGLSTALAFKIFLIDFNAMVLSTRHQTTVKPQCEDEKASGEIFSLGWDVCEVMIQAG